MREDGLIYKSADAEIDSALSACKEFDDRVTRRASARIAADYQDKMGSPIDP